MKKIIAIGSLLGLLFLIGIGLYQWQSESAPQTIAVELPDLETRKADLAQATLLLGEEKLDEALLIIRKYDPIITNQTDEGKQWLELLITASEMQKNSRQLIILYDYFPESFPQHEMGSALVSQRLLREGRKDEFLELRALWKGKETLDREWFFVDVDKHLFTGDKEGAIQFLQSKQFEGKEDTGRLVRLALLIVNESPKKSWTHLSEALKKDPENPNIHMYRGRLLEAAGLRALALSEYIAAARAKPDSIILRDQVAEFFKRYRQYKRAISVWDQLLDKPNTDPIWVKAWFWGRVASPDNIDWKSHTIPEGELKPLIEYLISLPQGVYWDQQKYDSVKNGNTYLVQQQATYWLRLISLLKNGNEKPAFDLLVAAPFEGVSWNPELEEGLLRILNYRLNGTLSHPNPKKINPSAKTEKAVAQPKPDHLPDWEAPFFAKLRSFAETSKSGNNSFQLPEDTHYLLNSDEVFAAAFLSAGWMEAGLALDVPSALSDKYPEWLTFAITQSLRFNRGPFEALTFATQQKSTPRLQMLIGELMISAKTPEAAIEQLQPLTEQENSLGRRATWLIGLVLADQQKYKEAKETILAKQTLADTTLGKETLARISLLQGEEKKAYAIYLEIEDQSPEAKSYLARKAFKQENWGRAEELTEELLIEYPNNITLRNNLHKIRQNLEQKSTVKLPASAP